MDLDKAETLALELMTQHGLRSIGWYFRFDKARRRYGCCNYGTRAISLSRPLTLIGREEDVRDTILHEIAHALTPGSGHNRVWRRQALAIGCSGQRCSVAKNKLTSGGWVGKCPGGHQHRLFRKPTCTYSCRQCTTAAGLRGYQEQFRIEYRRSPRRSTIAST